jgi:hypothetical protein
MIEVRHARHLEPFAICDLSQSEEQPDRIGSAGQRNSHTAACWKKSVSAKSATDRVEEAHIGKGLRAEG